MQKFILLVLFFGVLFRLYLSADSNFIFNMDSARDFVDVREMVVLRDIRLIGPTTAIDGVFNGPGWYYLLAIPFVLFQGDPYGAILLEILLWAVGGYFLLNLVNRFYGKLATFSVSLIWVSSNFILLATQYSYNPNPVLFLTPIFIYTLIKYIETKKIWYFLTTWFLAGLFLHFEIAASLFLPVVILLIIFISDKKLFKEKYFWLGIPVFLVTFLPQVLFEFKNHFFLTKSLMSYRSTSHGQVDLNPLNRFNQVVKSFYDTFLPTLMNFEFFTKIIIVSFLVVFGHAILNRSKLDLLTKTALLVLLISLFGLIPLRVDLMRWHLNAILIAALILIGFTINYFSKINFYGKVFSIFLVIILSFFSFRNLYNYVQSVEKGDPNNSILKNELTAIDYTYNEAAGKNFKAYVYMPSVIDYPYQYLFWWRGLKKYGYTPEDYAYLPNKPEYIKNKPLLEAGSNPESSGLVFLIKEPDQIGQRHLWENSFKHLELLKIATFGAITVETRKDK